MKNAAKTTGQLIPLILGRFNPLHVGHKYGVFYPIIKSSSIGSVNNNNTPFVVLLGSSQENRDKKKNPCSYEQRVNMVLITISELLQSSLMHMLPEDKLQELLAPGAIEKLINPDSCFIRYRDSEKKNTPPSLDPLLDVITSHCLKHEIPLNLLFPYTSLRFGEMGKAYQIRGEIYEKMAQLTAIAKYLKVNFVEELAPSEKEIVSATKIRNDFAENFSNVSPKIFDFLQQELSLALLNQRSIGDDKSNDKVTDASGFVSELAKSKKMLGFDDDRGTVVNVPANKIDQFLFYRGVASLNGKSQMELDNSHGKNEDVPNTEPENLRYEKLNTTDKDYGKGNK